MASRADSIANISSSNSAVYQALPGPRATRLLELQPGTGEEPLFCTLVVVEQLDTNTKYEALSYCWGDASLTENITCNSSPYLITRNLRDALRKLRLQDQARTVWVDAICINQHDSHERNHQVVFMRQIYAHASRVYVWLGDSSEERPLAAAADAIRRLATDILRAALGSGKPGEWLQKLAKVDDLSIVVEIPALKGKAALHWTSLAPFYTCEWFERVWIIQEIQACGEAWLMFDHDMVEWPFVALVARWITCDRNAIRANAVIPSSHRQSWQNRSNSGADFMAGRYLSTPLSVPFLWVLHQTRRFRSSDPRDKVYAMLQHPVRDHHGCSQDYDLHVNTPHLGIIPDYHKSATEVLLEVAVESVKRSRQLEILSYGLQGQATTLTGHDWVPRWDLDNVAIFDPMPTWMYHASGSERCAAPDSTGQLDLQGLLLGTISETGYLLTVKDGPHDEHQIDVHSPFIRVDSVERLVRLATQDRWTDGRHPMTAPSQSLPSHRKTVQMADFAAWLCGFVDQSSDKRLDDFYVAGAGYCCNFCECEMIVIDTALPKPPQVYGCDECDKGDFDLCHKCFLSEGKRCYNPAHTLQLRPRTGLWLQRETLLDMAELQARLQQQTPDIGSQHRFARSFSKNTAFNKWFSTSTDLVGSASLTVRPDDLVVVLFGANVPFVLRRRPDTGRYRVISDCYVDGMMDGQAVEMWKRGELEVVDFPMS